MVISQTSTTPRSVGFKEVFSATTFGAKGDGVTDDTAALTNWLAALNANAPCVGYLPAGTYVYSLASGLSVTAGGVDILGDGDKQTLLRNDVYGAPHIQLRADGCKVLAIGFQASKTGTISGTFAAGSNTFTPNGGLGNIAANSFLYLDTGTAGEPILVTSINSGAGTFTATTLLSHSGTFNYCLKSNITGTSSDGVANRNLAAGVYLANANYCEVRDCSFFGTVVGCSLRGSTAGNTFNNTGNRCINFYGKGLDQMVLCQQQSDPIFSLFYNEYVVESQTNTPAHTVYCTGTNISANAQRNKNVTVSKMVTYKNVYGAGYQLKFCDGLTAEGLQASGCSRAWDVEGCYNWSVTGCNGYNTPNVISAALYPDSNQCVAIVQDSWDGVVSGCVFDLLDEDGATIYNDSTDSFAAAAAGTNTWNIPGVTAGQTLVFDTGALTEKTYAATSSGTQITCTTINPHFNCNTTSSGTYAPGTVDIVVQAGVINVSLFANGFVTLDNGNANSETVFVNSVNAGANSFNATIANSHDGSVTPFTVTSGPIRIKIYPFTDDNSTGTGIGALFIRATDSQNANGQGSNNVQVIGCKAITAYSPLYTGSVHRCEGSKIIFVNNVLENTGLIGSATWYYHRNTTPAGAPSTLDSIAIINPTVWGCSNIIKSDANITNVSVQLNADLIYAGLTDSSFSDSGTGSSTRVQVTSSNYANIGSNSFPTLTVNSATPSVSPALGGVIKTKNSSGNLTLTSLTGSFRGNHLTVVCWDTTSASPGDKTKILPSTDFQVTAPWLATLNDTITFLDTGGNGSPASGRFLEVARSGGGGWYNVTGATPAVQGTGDQKLRCANGGATTVTNFTGGREGQILYLSSTNGNTTIQHNGTTIVLTGSANYVLSATKTLTIILQNGIWLEQARGGA